MEERGSVSGLNSFCQVKDKVVIFSQFVYFPTHAIYAPFFACHFAYPTASVESNTPLLMVLFLQYDIEKSCVNAGMPEKS